MWGASNCSRMSHLIGPSAWLCHPIDPALLKLANKGHVQHSAAVAGIDDGMQPDLQADAAAGGRTGGQLCSSHACSGGDHLWCWSQSARPAARPAAGPQRRHHQWATGALGLCQTGRCLLIRSGMVHWAGPFAKQAAHPWWQWVAHQSIQLIINNHSRRLEVHRTPAGGQPVSQSGAMPQSPRNQGVLTPCMICRWVPAALQAKRLPYAAQ